MKKKEARIGTRTQMLTVWRAACANRHGLNVTVASPQNLRRVTAPRRHAAAKIAQRPFTLSLCGKDYEAVRSAFTLPAIAAVSLPIT